MLTTLPDILRVRAQSNVLHVSFSLRTCTPPLKLSNRRRGANDHTPIQPGVNSLSFLTPDLDPAKNQAQRLCSQRTRNKLMHAITGNTTTSARPKLTLRLEALLPISPIPNLQYSKYTLLQFRGVCKESPPLFRLESSVNLSETTPPSVTPLKSSPSRTGRRRRTRLANGTWRNFKPLRRRTHPRIRRIKGIHPQLEYRRPPPPRGKPGSPFGEHEECPHKGGCHIDRPRGVNARRTSRRCYRQWQQACKNTKALRADSSAATPPQSTKAPQNRAQWFRTNVLWQQKITRKKKPKQNGPQTTPPLAYNRKLRVGSQNVQGMADTLKLKNLLLMMKEHNLDVMFLSETKSTSYYSYTSEQHLVVLSGNNKDKHSGVGVIVSPDIRPHLADIVQVNNRLIHIILNKRGGRIHLLGAYAPHSGHDHDTVRQPFWESLEEYVAKIPQPEPVYLTGDFNIRFQAQHKHDEGVTGPFTYGKGSQAIDHTAQSNRSLCVRTMLLLDMLEVASYKTPNPVHHITFRDKTAPPKDWSQYVLDPLIMQQVYSELHRVMPSQSLEVAARVRSFLPLAQPLPPPRVDPSPDPVRFQRLDHTFTRRQWLSSVNSCRSKLHTGYPSDHYLLVTEVQVKLARRDPPPPKPPEFDFSRVNIDQRLAYNAQIRGSPQSSRKDGSSDPDHTARMSFYTDGSGTGGRCTKTTPAGWGWCTKQHGEWITARGRVETDHTARFYYGAQVGSNNTGELTAIIEALLYALEQGCGRADIYSDSQWAINVITGRWRAKSHKTLVGRAHTLSTQTGMTVSFHWVKAHAGTEGNEKADALANAGRTQGRNGGSKMVPPDTPPQDHTPTMSADTMVHAMKQAAADHFPYKERRAHTPWIKDHTLQLLAQARAAQADGHEDWKTQRNKAKRAARRDRIDWVHDQLLADPDASHSPLWNAVRRQKKGFVGKKSHPIVNGKPVPWSKSHAAFRDHLEGSQWAPPNIPDHTAARRRARPGLRPQLPDEGRFTLDDLQRAIQKSKGGKAPGPDQVRNELFMLLDREGEAALLSIYNKCWEEGDIPGPWAEAIVVSIYKGKGLDTDVTNYRPISLLNTIYKIYAAMLQHRLAKSSEHFLRSRQYGFREGRGTQQPIFVLRRAMEWAEMTNKPLQLLFLDWKQAFDSLDHTAMLEALRRFGVSELMLKTIQAIYQSPTFYTRGPDHTAAAGSVHSGIRQGCPLSPSIYYSTHSHACGC